MQRGTLVGTLGKVATDRTLPEGGLWEGRGRKGVMRAYEKAEGQETVTEISDMAAC